MGFYKITRLANIFTNLFSSKKISKIILFIVLFGVICFLFSGKVFAAEDVSVSILNGATVNGQTNIVIESQNDLNYFKTKKGVIYHITNLRDNGVRINISEISPYVGLSVSDRITTISAHDSYDFVGTGDVFLLCSLNTTSTGLYVSVTSDYSSNVDGAYTGLVDQITLQNLWSQIGFAVPLIGVAVLFVIGFIIFRKLSGGSSKGKVKF